MIQAYQYHTQHFYWTNMLFKTDNSSSSIGVGLRGSQINVSLIVMAVTHWGLVSPRSKTDWRVVFCLCLLSSCRKKHRLSRLESFTKRVSKKKPFTLAGYSQAEAPLNSRWLLDLWLLPPTAARVSACWNTPCRTQLVSSLVRCFLPPSLQLIFFSFFNDRHHLYTCWAPHGWRVRQHSGPWVRGTANIPLIGPKLNRSLAAHIKNLNIVGTEYPQWVRDNNLGFCSIIHLFNTPELCWWFCMFQSIFIT